MSNSSNLLRVMDTLMEDGNGRRGRYNGTISVTGSHGLPQGKGTMEYFDNDNDDNNNKNGHKQKSNTIRSYDGDWHNGKYHGDGTLTMSNDDSYQGQFVYGDKHGIGKYTWTKQDRMFEGTFCKNIRQGHGTFIWNFSNIEKQSKYVGNFHNNKRHGNGTYITPQLTYTGEFNSGQFHGYGTCEYKELEKVEEQENKSSLSSLLVLRIYKGFWKQGKRNGHGVEINPDGTIRHDGEWIQDQPILARAKANGGGGGGATDENSFQQTDTYVHHHHIQQKKTAKPTVTDRVVGQQLKQLEQDLKPLSNGEKREGGGSDDNDGSDDDQKLLVVNGDMIQDAFGRVGHYRGTILVKTRLPHGAGTMTYDLKDSDKMTDISQYVGFWNNGHYEGTGNSNQITYRNGNVYTGSVENSLRSGRGEYVWKSSSSNGGMQASSSYKGLWKNDVKHGSNAIMMYCNGDYYEGSYMNGHRHYGKYVFASTDYDGSYYRGSWSNNNNNSSMLHGKGIFVNLTTHRHYEGNFENGQYHGYGIEKVYNVDDDIDNEGNDKNETIIFQGNWENGQPIPSFDDDDKEKKEEDTITNNNGEEMEKDNKKRPPLPVPLPDEDEAEVSENDDDLTAKNATPNGTTNNTVAASTASTSGSIVPLEDTEPSKPVVDLVVQDGQLNSGRYTGLISTNSNLPHGVGRMVYDDKCRIHEGFWHHGHRHGHGRCIFVQIGDFHEGSYNKNVREGPGRYIWKDGRVFDGTYKNDERHGHGTFQYPNGDIYQGNFQNGARSGLGTLVFNNKTGRYHGEWRAGAYHGRGRLRWQEQFEDGPPEVHFYEGEFARGVFHGVGAHGVNNELHEYGIWEMGKFRRPMPRPPSHDPSQQDEQNGTANDKASIASPTVNQEQTPAKEDSQEQPVDRPADVMTPPPNTDELEIETALITPVPAQENNGALEVATGAVTPSDTPNQLEESTRPTGNNDDTELMMAGDTLSPVATGPTEDEEVKENGTVPAMMDEPPLPPTSRPSSSAVAKQTEQTVIPDTLNDDLDEHRTNAPAALVATCEETVLADVAVPDEDGDETEPVVAIGFDVNPPVDAEGSEEDTHIFALPKLATYQIGNGIALHIVRGSVVDFDCPKQGAIVNAANEGCLGGGGVDGAISQAGGVSLINDRFALPVLNDEGVRCPTGEAKLTGPGDYGSLKVPFVVHAVGPNYSCFIDFDEPDRLLRDAYQATLVCCRDTASLEGEDGTEEGKQESIHHVAFSLLSSGIFRGCRSLEEVLEIGVYGIRDWVSEADNCGALESIVLCAFNAAEAETLVQVSQKAFEPTEESE